jgi:adenosylcobinamide-GDP ribazoletransferase
MAALLAAAALALATGALHEDGLADLCDGIGGARGDRARALDIMRDSRIGAYGALGLGLVLALRVMALALMPLGAVPFALVAGAVLSRASMVRAMAGADYARPSGAGGAVAGEMADAVLQRALLTGAVVAVIVWPFLGFMAGVLGALALAGAHLALRRLYETRLGGWTGDCLGAVQVTGEAALLVGLLAGMG